MTTRDSPTRGRRATPPNSATGALLVLVCTLLQTGCAPSAATPRPSVPPASTASNQERSGSATSARTSDAPRANPRSRGVGQAAAPTVQILERTPIVGPAPRIQIRAPRDRQLIRDEEVLVRLEVQNWPLAPPIGNHIHIKVDNREEIAVHDLSGPFSLTERYQARFGEPLNEGTHVLRVFLSRPNHESVKVPTAFKLITFHYRARTPDFSLDRRTPMLTYSRPQGCASDPVRLLDFFITNLNGLSRNGYRVNYEINGMHRASFQDGHRIAFDALGSGESTIRLRLIGPRGNLVPGPFNDTTRTVSGDEGCPELGLIPDDDADEDDEVLEPETLPHRGARVPRSADESF